MNENDLPRHKCALTIEHNDHKNIYKTVADWLEEDADFWQWESEEAKQKAIDTDQVWTMQWYPDTPIGFYSIAAPTLKDLLRMGQRIQAAEDARR